METAEQGVISTRSKRVVFGDFDVSGHDPVDCRAAYGAFRLTISAKMFPRLEELIQTGRVEQGRARSSYIPQARGSTCRLSLHTQKVGRMGGLAIVNRHDIATNSARKEPARDQEQLL